MSEFKEGVDLDGQFTLLSMDEKTAVIEQIAEAVASLQRVEVPKSVSRFSALTFDASGEMADGQMPLLKGGPWESYAALWTAKLHMQLAEAERSMNNMLFDTKTKRISAVLDFDWSVVTHPCDEFLTGLWDIGGGIHDSLEAFQTNIITGDFSTQPDGGLSGEDLASWDIAQVWNRALAKKKGGIIRLSEMAGVQSIRELRSLESKLCPFELSNEAMLRRMSDEQKQKRREELEGEILGWLEERAV